jgi:23S rRNA (pseudouridine1915-N3)-methyltransferase
VNLRILAASNKQPAWVDAAFGEYAKRFSGGWHLELRTVPLGKRSARSTPGRAVEDEGRRMLKQIGSGEIVVALSESGTAWNTDQLTDQLRRWAERGSPVCFLIGGPDGLADCCESRADVAWSLSALTLPHGIVRIVIAEALYRAWSVLRGHPYHRA